jgi:integrase/recombinase XerD
MPKVRYSMKSIGYDMKPEEFLSLQEFKMLLQNVRDNRDRCILLMLGAVGLRAGEMCKIKVSDIDFEKGYLHIPASNAKYKKPRTVVLLPAVMEALHNQILDSIWLLPSRAGDHITPRHVQHILDAIATRAGLQETTYKDKAGKSRQRIHPHLLRHSFAIWSLDAGVPIGDLQSQLGHASLATTGIYLKASPNHRREAYLRSGLSDSLV